MCDYNRASKKQQPTVSRSGWKADDEYLPTLCLFSEKPFWFIRKENLSLSKLTLCGRQAIKISTAHGISDSLSLFQARKNKTFLLLFILQISKRSW